MQQEQKVVYLRVYKDTWETIRDKAKQEGRTLTKVVNRLLLRGLDSETVSGWNGIDTDTHTRHIAT